MQQILNRKLVDTDACEFLAVYSNGADTRNFSWFCERLYLTPTGDFVLHGEGHGNSPYGSHSDCDRSRGMGEKLVSLTPPEVLDWLEKRQIQDDLDRIYELAGKMQTQS